MEHYVTLVVQGANFSAPKTKEALSLIPAQVLCVKGHNAWVLVAVEASFFTSEKKVARAAAAELAKAVPGAEAVAFETQDQAGGVRHHLTGDRWDPPAGLGAGMYASDSDIAWFDEIERRAHGARKNMRQKRKQEANLEGGRPVLTSLDESPEPNRPAPSTIDGPSL